LVSVVIQRLIHITYVKQILRTSRLRLISQIRNCFIASSAKIGESEYRATDIIMLGGNKKCEIEARKSSSYLPTIQRMTDPFEIKIDTINSGINGTTRNNSFLTYENNSTLGIKILSPSWQRLEYDAQGVLFPLNIRKQF
jgi:hypothetical protein